MAALTTPSGFTPTPTQENLLACFSVCDPSQIHRSYKSDTFKGHDFRLHAVTAKGAGGTGKTTTAAILASGLVMRGHSVVATNTDSQPSLEDRLLGKVVHQVYHDDWQLFKELNGLVGHSANGLPSQDLLQSLQMMFQRASNYKVVPPKVIAIDVTRLRSLGYTDTSNNARLFVVFCSEDISNWDQQLSQSRVLMRFAESGSVHKGAFGAFYALMQMCAYVFSAAHVVADMGPGNGTFNRNVFGCCHFWTLPLNIDGKAEATLASFAEKLPVYTAEALELRSITAGDDNPYPMPTHPPKFLGVVFTRLGGRGSVRPYNQYFKLLHCLQRLQNSLLPACIQCGMALTQQQYQLPLQAILDVIQAGGNAFGNLPQLQGGVACLLREFDSLQIMSERESVAVPFLQKHHFLTMNGSAYEVYMQQLAANPLAPMPEDNFFLVPATDAGLAYKVQNIAQMVGIYLDMVVHIAGQM